MLIVRHGFSVSLFALGCLISHAAILSATDTAAGSDSAPVLRVRVVDESGKPVADAEATALGGKQTDYPFRIPPFRISSWRPATDGCVTFTADDLCSLALGEKPEGMYEVIARAHGYASRTARVELPTTCPETLVKLGRGRRVELLLKPPAGCSIPPDLRPRTVRANLAPAAWAEIGDHAPANRGLVDLTPMENLGNGRYAFQIDDNTPQLYLMMHHPGYLRAYQAETPFSKDDLAKGRIEVTLPQPAPVTVRFLPEEAGRSGPATLNAQVSRLMSKRVYRVLDVAVLPFDLSKGEFTLSDLGPGRYYFRVKTADMDSESQCVELASGASKTVTLKGLPVIEPIQVVDDKGDPIPAAEGYIVGLQGTRQEGWRWKSSTVGIVKFRQTDVYSGMPGRDDNTAFRVYLRAPGFAPKTVTVKAGKPGIAPQRVQLEKGSRVELTIKPPEKKALPADLQPVIVQTDELARAWSSLSSSAVVSGEMERVFSTVLLENLGNGHYAFQVTEDTPGLYVLIEHPGFVRQFEAGPFTKQQLASGKIETTVPATGGLNVTLRVPDDKTTAAEVEGVEPSLEYSCILNIARRAGKGPDMQTVPVSSMGTRRTKVFSVSDLAPGIYHVDADPVGRMRTQIANESVEITAGTTATVAVQPDSSLN
jgi:hypothetical protein